MGNRHTKDVEDGGHRSKGSSRGKNKNTVKKVKPSLDDKIQNSQNFSEVTAAINAKNLRAIKEFDNTDLKTAFNQYCFPFGLATLQFCQSYAPISDPKGNAPDCPERCFQLTSYNTERKVKSETAGSCDIYEGNVAASMLNYNQQSSSIYGFVLGHPLPDFVYEVPEGYIPTKLKASLLDENDQPHLIATVSYDYQKMNMPENEQVEEAGQVKDELNSKNSMLPDPKQPDREYPDPLIKTAVAYLYRKKESRNEN